MKRGQNKRKKKEGRKTQQNKRKKKGGKKEGLYNEHFRTKYLTQTYKNIRFGN